MEINITRLITDLDPAELSSSVAERGPNAGPETWGNSVAAATESPLLTAEERPKARAFFRSFGAWTDEEEAAWTNQELDALVLQYAAGDLREAQGVAPGDGIGGIDWDEAERLAEAGTIGGNLFLYGDELWITLEP